MEKERTTPSEITDVKFLEDMLESLNIGALIVTEDRMIRYSNSTITSILGYQRNEIVGKKTSILYDDRRSDPSDKKEIYDRLRSFGFHEGRATGISKDGKRIDLLISSFVVKPHRDAIVLISDAKEDRNLSAVAIKGFLRGWPK